MIFSTTEQLYNLKTDVAEKHNVIEKYPAEAKKMKQLLKNIQAQGTRSDYKIKMGKEVTKNKFESGKFVIQGEIEIHQ